MVFAYIHQCRHVEFADSLQEPHLYDSQVTLECLFDAGTTITPIFTDTCCSAYECQSTDRDWFYEQEHMFPYTTSDYENRVAMVNTLDSEYENCSQSVEDYNLFAEQHNLSPVNIAEFETLLVLVYNWISRAKDFANNNGARFFHDVCLAIAESTYSQVIAMRVSVDLATLAMPAPETADIVHPDDVCFPDSQNQQLGDLSPEISVCALKLPYSPTATYGFQPIPDDYVRFEAVWRQKVEYMNALQSDYYHFP